MLFSLHLSAKEYKSIKECKKLTGSEKLTPFDWLEKDRLNNTARWVQVNRLNFTQAGRYSEYKTIPQRRDFYKWVYLVLKQQGHEIKSAAMAYVVTGMYAKAFKNKNRPFAPKWFLDFADKGTALVMSKLVPRLYDVFTGKDKIVGEQAQLWDKNYLEYEQCEVLDTLFNSLTPKQLEKMNHIAKGQNVYRFFVKKELRYTPPSLTNCKDRIKYGIEVVMPYAEKVL